MPRGDHVPGCCRSGQICKRLGEPRRLKKKGSSAPQEPHRVLEARIKSWMTIKDPLDLKRRHDGKGNTYRKPGSQRKGNR